MLSLLVMAFRDNQLLDVCDERCGVVYKLFSANLNGHSKLYDPLCFANAFMHTIIAALHPSNCVPKEGCEK
jgi:hypothetical protein